MAEEAITDLIRDPDEKNVERPFLTFVAQIYIGIFRESKESVGSSELKKS
jgi:hypothetical protein